MHPPHIDHRYAPPPRPETYIVSNPERQASVSVKSITVPAVLGASLLAGAILVTYAFTTEFNDLRNSIDRLSNKLVLMTDGVGGRIDRIEREIDSRTSDRYTRTAHDLWCERTERLNQSLGWKCADAPSIPRGSFQPLTRQGGY